MKFYKSEKDIERIVWRCLANIPNKELFGTDLEAFRGAVRENPLALNKDNAPRGEPEVMQDRDKHKPYS